MSNQSDKQSNPTSGVTEVYVTFVRKNKIAEFREWLRHMHQLEVKFPGFQKSYVQVPQDKNDDSWITFLQFDTQEHLDNWLNSSERLSMLEKSNELMKSQKNHLFAGWFSESVSAPPAWKQAMLLLLALFPAVMLGAKYILPLLKDLNPAIARFLDLAINITMLSLVLMPVTIYLLGWWLKPESKLKEYLGISTVIILYLLEIAVFL